MQFVKQNIALVLGLSIPVAMILFIAAMVYVPQLYIQPQYSFIYATNDNRYDEYGYRVEGDRIVYQPRISEDINHSYTEPTLYVYDVETNRSRQITLEDAQLYRLDSSTESPDGFKVVRGGSGGDFIFFFGGGYDPSHYLVGQGVSKKLNIDESSNYWDFHLVGWIKK
jgi:hypothetical protein